MFFSFFYLLLFCSILFLFFFCSSNASRHLLFSWLYFFFFLIFLFYSFRSFCGFFLLPRITCTFREILQVFVILIFFFILFCLFVFVDVKLFYMFPNTIVYICPSPSTSDDRLRAEVANSFGCHSSKKFWSAFVGIRQSMPEFFFSFLRIFFHFFFFNFPPADECFWFQYTTPGIRAWYWRVDFGAFDWAPLDNRRPLSMLVVQSASALSSYQQPHKTKFNWIRRRHRYDVFSVLRASAHSLNGTLLLVYIGTCFWIWYAPSCLC